MSNLVDISSNFDQVVLESKKPVLVDFWAQWCGPCRNMSPILQKFSEEYEDILVAKVDVDSEEQTALEYQIRALPTFILFVNGKEIERSSGSMSLDAIVDFVKKHVEIGE